MKTSKSAQSIKSGKSFGSKTASQSKTLTSTAGTNKSSKGVSRAPMTNSGLESKSTPVRAGFAKDEWKK